MACQVSLLYNFRTIAYISQCENGTHNAPIVSPFGHWMPSLTIVEQKLPSMPQRTILGTAPQSL